MASLTPFLVIPSVLYEIVIWGSGPKLKDLEVIHIRAARLIHKLPNSFKDSDILTKVGWMPLEYFYKSRILTITHNAYYNLGLQEINYLVTKNSNNHNLRKSLNAVLTRPETELGRRSFVHGSAIAWNALPDNLKDSPNPSIFKYNVKRSKQTILNINFGMYVCFQLQRFRTLAPSASPEPTPVPAQLLEHLISLTSYSE